MSKIRIKKHYHGCRALSGDICSLNYSIEKVIINYGGAIKGWQSSYYKPREICPKPKTIMKFIKLKEIPHD